MKKLEVILQKDVIGLGAEGDIKEVAMGYARNYLIPFHHAVFKTKINLKKRAANLEAISERKKQKLEASKSLFEKLHNMTLQFGVRVSEEGKLFGSIGVKEIHQELEAQGFQISKGHIHLAKPIKMLGDYTVSISVYMDLKAVLQIHVINQEDLEGVQAEASNE